MEFDLSAATGLFFHPPAYPDFSAGILARWSGKEQMIKEALLDFYTIGFKDGFIACAALVAAATVAYLVLRSVRNGTPNA